MKTKRESLKLIDAAYTALDVLNNISWEKYLDKLFAMNWKEEREHDHLRPAGTARGLSVSMAAKLFCVCWIAECLLNKRKYEVKDYLHIRQSAFYAAALAANYGAEIVKAWEDFDLKELSDLNYADLIK